MRMATVVPLTTAHSEGVGQETAVGPTAGEVVQGWGSSDQSTPFQSRMDGPTTAVQSDGPGHEIPTGPAGEWGALEPPGQGRPQTPSLRV